MKSLLAFLVVAMLAISVTPVVRVHAEQPPADISDALLAPNSGAPQQAQLGRSLLQTTLVYVQNQQREIYRQLAASLRSVKAHGTAATVMSLSFVCFLYGSLHAVGPGHGKSIISAYLVANERAVRRGILLSFCASLAQAVSAIALVSCLTGLLRGIDVTAEASLGVMTIASAGLIAAVGACMTWASLRRLADGETRELFAAHVHREHEHGSATLSGASGASARVGCDHDHRFASHRLLSETRLPRLAMIVAAIGARPCSGAVFVLLFANAIGLYTAGVWAILAMALGTALTVSALAALTLCSKRASVRLVSLNTRWLDWTYRTMSLAGSVAVLCLGLLFLFSSASAQGPFPLR